MIVEALEAARQKLWTRVCWEYQAFFKACSSLPTRARRRLARRKAGKTKGSIHHRRIYASPSVFRIPRIEKSFEKYHFWWRFNTIYLSLLDGKGFAIFFP